MTVDGRSPDRQHGASQQFADRLIADGVTPDDQTVFDRSGSPAPSLLGNEANKTDFGDYELLEEIARGGMGLVFKARQKRLNRVVALKVILAGEYAKPEDVLRFQAEAEAAAKLHHAGIVPIYEVGENDGRPFLSMGFIEGETLESKVARGPLEGKDAARLIAEVSKAVAYAHQQGIVHRDLKPGNILLNDKGEPFVTDFGLAKRTDSDSQLTGTGQLIGTPSYMSPEQAAGINDAIGPLTDVYSLGAVLYCLLTGHPPFRAANLMDTVAQVTNQEPIPPRQVNGAVERDLQTICLKCLQKDPAHRYESAEELGRDLERYLNLEPIKATAVGRVSRCWRWCRRNPVIASLAATLATLLVALAIVGPVFALRQTYLRADSDRLVIEKALLIDELTHSMQQEESARIEAETIADRLHENLVKMYVDRGNSEIMSGNPVNAAPWFAAALSQDAEDPEREREHRFRLSAILDQAARPEQIWRLAGETEVATVSSGGELVAAAGRDGEIVVWDVRNGNVVLHPENLTPGMIRALVFSRDGTRLIAASGTRIHFWDLTTRKPAIPMIRCSARVESASLDESGHYLVVGLSDETLLVYDADTGDLVRSRSNSGVRILQVGVHGVARRVFARGWSGNARLFDLESLKPIADLEHEGDVKWAEFDPTGRLLVTTSSDRSAKIWSASTGELVTAPLMHPEHVRVATFDSTGTRLATGSYDSAARIWDAETGELLSGPLKSENSIWRLDFSPDGRYLVTASLDHTARIWHIDSGKEVTPPLRHGFLVNAAEFLPAGDRLMTASADRTVRIWSFKPRANLVAEFQHSDAVRSCRFSADKKFLLTASADGTARIWSVDPAEAESTEIILRHQAEVLTAEFSHDEKYIVTASGDRTARVWSSADGQPVTPALEHSSRVFEAEFSPDDRLILTASEDGTARLWEVQSGRLLHKFSHDASCLWATFDQQGRQILTCSADDTARVWDAQTGEPKSPPLRHAEPVEGGGFSPDGRYVVTASRDHTAQIWEIESGAKVTPPLTHFAGVKNACFTPNGRFVLTGARDGSASLWNAHDGTAATPPMSIGHGLVRAVVSPCGQLIATGGGRGAILWDSTSGRLIAAEMPHDDWVLEVRFSADSELLATACDDGTARIWRVPRPDGRSSERLVDLAHLISSHRADPADGLVPLSPEELQQLLEELQQQQLLQSTR